MLKVYMNFKIFVRLKKLIFLDFELKQDNCVGQGQPQRRQDTCKIKAKTFQWFNGILNSNLALKACPVIFFCLLQVVIMRNLKNGMLRQTLKSFSEDLVIICLLLSRISEQLIIRYKYEII